MDDEPRVAVFVNGKEIQVNRTTFFRNVAFRRYELHLQVAPEVLAPVTTMVFDLPDVMRAWANDKK